MLMIFKVVLSNSSSGFLKSFYLDIGCLLIIFNSVLDCFNPHYTNV